jgi:demethylmenaquinone methyltransferase / 2-methoxy-6-polyprenyl-1,4-benzoquinol methylase
MELKETLSTKEDILIRDQMAKMVGTYDKYMKRITLGREESLRKMTVDLALVKEGESVLEIGCATGSLTIVAKKQAGSSGSVSAIDLIPGMIDASREKAKKAGLDINFQTGSIESIPFQDQQFDAVICSFMIFHMSEQVRNKGIEEIFRVLKPKGRLLVLDVAVPPRVWSRGLLKLFLGFLFKHELEELEPKLESTGFSKIEISKAPFRVFGLPLLSFLRANKFSFI